jgi:phage I-like protein
MALNRGLNVKLSSLAALDSRQRYTLDDPLPVAKQDAKGPKWNRLFPLGMTKYRADFPGGKLSFTREWCEALVRNAKDTLAKGHRIQANYHHLGGIEVHPAAALENTIASGWIVDVELRADGPYGLFEWTPRAKAFIDNDELGYLSPEFHLDYPNRDTGKSQGPTLLGAALTNTPFLKELPRVAASDNPADEAKGETMDKKLLCARLGLPEASTDEDVQARLLKLSELEKAQAEAGLKLSEAGVKLADLQALAKKAIDGQAAAEAKLAKFETDAKTSEATLFADTLVKEKRIQPVMREAAVKLALTDMALAKATLGANPPLKLEELGHNGGAPGSEAAGLKTLKAADPAAQAGYWSLVDKEMEEKKVSLQVATRSVNKQHPELANALALSNN